MTSKDTEREALPDERSAAFLLRQALNALEHHREQTRPIHRNDEVIAALRDWLAGREAPAEPRGSFMTREQAIAFCRKQRHGNEPTEQHIAATIDAYSALFGDMVPADFDAAALTASEAVVAFAAWLTCRDEPTTFGASHDAAPVAEAVKAFNESQGFATPADDFHRRIKPYPARGIDPKGKSPVGAADAPRSTEGAASHSGDTSASDAVGDFDALPPSIEGRLSVWMTLGADLHPNTVNLVVRFARALAAKLAAAEKKYGYSDGWRDAGWMDECRAKLMEHIAKGDPRDVAAYCAFLWHHGESTALTASSEASSTSSSAPGGEGTAQGECQFIATARSGKQHDTGRVTYANGGFFADTSSPADARTIADALNRRAPTERTPLTDEQIAQIARRCGWAALLHEFARGIERASRSEGEQT